MSNAIKPSMSKYCYFCKTQRGVSLDTGATCDISVNPDIRVPECARAHERVSELIHERGCEQQIISDYNKRATTHKEKIDKINTLLGMG